MIRSGAMGPVENLSGNLDFFTLFTSLDITATGDYADPTQKDFEAVVQTIGLRAMPVLMNNPISVTDIEDYGAGSMTGAGWILKFAFEREGVHTVSLLVDELHGIVLNGGVVDTKNTINMEFSKQELI
jgi:hypothetical protein